MIQRHPLTKTIERALDLVISEHERNRLVAQAPERFVTFTSH
jgi:hypothetical protein